MVKTISVLVDNDSWIIPFANELVSQLVGNKYQAFLCRNQTDIRKGSVCFMLGCTSIVLDKYLSLNRYNLVIHESELPKGKGFAPVAWQILNGNKTIPMCLIEASSEVDSGDIWLVDYIQLEGDELNSEWRRLQGQKSIEMCIEFINNFEQLKPTKQVGKSTFYPRRKPEDSELDINKTISEQFNLLRVVDNELYPSFFYLKGKKYILDIKLAEN